MLRKPLPALCLFSALIAAGTGLGAGKWDSLLKDGLHDPQNPAIEVLQEPAEALGVLAPDTAGNKVNWVTSIEEGLIQPRSSLTDKRKPRVLNSTVLMKNTLPMRFVRFPHRAHTQWMSCKTCHEKIFIPEVDANPISMGRILEGKDCGICHGAVSFPLTECDRCHNTDSSTVKTEVTTVDTPAP